MHMGKKAKNYSVEELQFELLKMIAEQNHERIWEYDVEQGDVLIYEVVAGEFVKKRIYEDYLNRIDEHSMIVHEDDRKAYNEAFLSCLKRPSFKVVDYRFLNSKIKEEWYRVFFASIAGEDKKVSKVVGRIISIHQEHEAKEMIRRKAELDALTDIYNHATYEQMGEKALATKEGEVALVMIDLDDFKSINDSQGHKVGDMVLSQTGKILKSASTGIGFAGRLGGDEFSLLLWGLKDKEEVRSFLENLHMTLKSTIIFDMEYSASFGVALKGNRTMTYQDLFYEADQAVYTAKRFGKNQVVFFDEKEQFEPEESELESEVTVSEDQTILDSKKEFCFVVDAQTKEILFINQSAKENLEIDLYSDTKILDDYFAKKNAVTSSRHILWQNKDCILYVVTVLSNQEQMQEAIKKNTEIVDVVNKLTSIQQSYGQKNITKEFIMLLSEYYDSDCVLLIKSVEDNYTDTEEVHKHSAKTMVRLLKETILSGQATEFKSAADAQGNIFIRNVETIKEKNEGLYYHMKENRIWGIFSASLVLNGVDYGVVLVANPRNNTDNLEVFHLVKYGLGLELARSLVQMQTEYKMLHDDVTGLCNRSCFMDWYKTWGNDIKSAAVFATDIVGLRRTNNEFGFQRGDEQLKEVAECLNQVFHGYSTFRFEQDEIVAICLNIEKKSFETLVSMAKEKLAELSFVVEYGYSWSKKVDIRKQYLESIHVMESRKQKHLIDSVMIDESNQKQSSKVQTDIKRLMGENRFRMFLQPKVDSRTEKTVGAEALVRYFDEQYGMITPMKFISVLEKNYAIHLLDFFMLEEAYKFQKNRMDENKELVPISVNLSKHTLIHPEFIDTVKRLSDEYGVSSEYMELEVTETIGDMDQIIVSNVANSLSVMGFKLAMDDFGTNYSNLAVLSKFNFDIVKIDRSMVQEVATNKKSATMLKHLISMIDELGISLVAEGVETKEQKDMLGEMGVYIIQGFYYGKPIPCDEFSEEFLDE